MAFDTNFSASFTSIGFANFSTQAQDAVAEATTLFKCLSVDDQLAALWFVYTELGKSMTAAAPGAARLQLAEGLLHQIKQLSFEEQLQVQREIVTGADTPFSRAYGVLGTNTKLAFWYQLAQWMEQGFVVPMPAGYSMNRDTQQVFETLKSLDIGQQITVLRNVAAGMGVDPLA